MTALRSLLFTITFCAALGCHSELVFAQNWTQAAGIPSETVIGVIDHRGDMFALSVDSVYRSLDSGTTWQPTPVQPGDKDNLVTIHSHGNHIYLGTTNAGVYRSSDGGIKWEPFNEGYPGSTAVEFLTLGESLYVGTAANGIFVRNASQSSTWTPFNEGLERFGVETMATSGDLLLANVGLSTYVRARGGAAWKEFLIDPAGGQLAVNKFFRFGEYLFAGVGLGVYRGNPDATGWQQVGINLLPFRPVEHFAAHGKRLLAVVPYKLEHFICYSDDGGTTWGVWAHEFAELVTMRVMGNRVFAGRADGLWYFDLGTLTGADDGGDFHPTELRLEQNYPNPFNPRTSVKWQVASGGEAGIGSRESGVSVKLAVYDLLGREVAVLVDERKVPGSYEVQFDGSNLASGVYVYRLSAGSFVQARKMLLIR